MPADWLEAFFMLEMHLQSIDDGTRQVVFLDELPWMDTGNPDVIKSIIGMLGTRSMGYSRQEIASRAACSNGGDLTESLSALIASDFVMKYVPFGYGKREVHYKLIDLFCIFYLRFVENNHVIPDTFWQQHVTVPAIASWRGYAFENVCFNHIPQIKRALGISGIGTEQSAWTKTGEGDAGTQIDLLITRRDNVVNMCEIKFYSEEFTVDRKYDLLLRHRQNLLQEAIPQKCIVHKTLITTYGIKDNEYRWSFDNVITMDALFENP